LRLETQDQRLFWDKTDAFGRLGRDRYSGWAESSGPSERFASGLIATENRAKRSFLVPARHSGLPLYRGCCVDTAARHGQGGPRLTLDVDISGPMA